MFQNDRVQQPWGVCLNIAPSVIVDVQERRHFVSLPMALGNILHKGLDKCSVSAHGPEGERLCPPVTPSGSFLLLTALKPNDERTSSIPKPVTAWCGNQRQLF